MAFKPPAAVVLLGAQRFEPSLGAALQNLRVTGRIALITAGWQERELEDEELSAHLGGDTINLRLHARGEEIFKKDTELRTAHRERQDALRHHQDFYRIRLEHLVAADNVMEKRAAPPLIAAEEAKTSVEALRELDNRHLARCARLHSEFEERWSLATRPSVALHRKEIAETVQGCGAIAISGGHVASLLNRLMLFGIGELVEDRLLFAWSAGAMALSERVVLFHDDPPQGPGVSEVLDAGLGLVPGVIVLPQPEQRLRLDRRDRLRALVSRFAPAACLALPACSRVTWRAGKLSAPVGVVELRGDGSTGVFDPSAAAPLEARAP